MTMDQFMVRLKEQIRRYGGPSEPRFSGAIRYGGRCPLELAAGLPAGAHVRAMECLGLSREDAANVMDAADFAKPKRHYQRSLRRRILSLNEKLFPPTSQGLRGE